MKSTRSPLLRRLLGLAGLSAVLLAGCGGGTSTVDPFIPARVFLFGDETALMVEDGADKGRRWGINGLNANSVFDCRLSATWAQTLAGTYGLRFAACPYRSSDDITAPPTLTEFKALQRAVAGSGALDVEAQIDAQLADTTPDGGLSDADMVGIMTGLKDVVEVYEALVDRSEYTLSSARAELDRRAALLASQVNRMANQGARVLISTVPRLDTTPYGRDRDDVDPTQAEIQRDLSDTFNARLRRDILQDGSKIGLVMADDLILAMVRNPANFGLTEDGARLAACTVTPLTACTVDTLIGTADDRFNLWADNLHLGPIGHRLLGQQFVTRALNNPF